MKDKTKDKKKEEIIEKEPDNSSTDGLEPKIDYEEKYKRALADYQNLLKQSAREKQEFVKYANEQMLHEFLPVYDNLKIALKHTSDLAEDNAWVQGVKFVVKQFADALKEQGVEEIEVDGKDFDHNCMEAVSGNGEKVIKELRPGYKLNGRVIVPAKVELETVEKE